MTEFAINVSEVEELQMTKGLIDLDQMFARAQSTVVQGGAVVLTRKNADGSNYKFDEITTETDLATYKESVYKYL